MCSPSFNPSTHAHRHINRSIVRHREIIYLLYPWLSVEGSRVCRRLLHDVEGGLNISPPLTSWYFNPKGYNASIDDYVEFESAIWQVNTASSFAHLSLLPLIPLPPSSINVLLSLTSSIRAHRITLFILPFITHHRSISLVILVCICTCTLSVFWGYFIARFSRMYYDCREVFWAGTNP